MLMLLRSSLWTCGLHCSLSPILEVTSMINCSCLQCGGCSQLCDRNPCCDAFTTEGREAPIDADRRGPAIATLSVVTVVVQSQQSSECVVPGFAGQVSGQLSCRTCIRCSTTTTLGFRGSQIHFPKDTNLQSLVKCLGHSGIAFGTICSQARLC